MSKTVEYEKTWGTSGLVVRRAFTCQATFRPGKGSSKQSVTFWDAKTMLDKLGIEHDHIRSLSKNQDVVLMVRLIFFKNGAYEHAMKIISGQPNHTVFLHGQPVEIQVNPMEIQQKPTPPATSPGFDRKEKGCRPDTVFIRGLPAKWFNVNTAAFLDDSLDNANAAYMQEDHALNALFSEFGELSNLEVVPAVYDESTSNDAASLASASYFDIYVQFKSYDSVLNALAAFSSGRVLCHSSHVKVVVPIDVEVDTTGYLSDAKIRQRRFAREKKRHEQQAKAAQALAAEKKLQASIEEAKSLLDPLSEEFKRISQEALELGIDKDEFSKVESSFDILRDAPSMEVVETIRRAFAGIKKKIREAIAANEEKARLAQCAEWKKRINNVVNTSDKKLSKLADELKKFSTIYASFCDHPAIIADLAAAKDSLKLATKSATVMDIDRHTKEEDVVKHLDRMNEDVEEAVYMVHAVIARLEVVNQFHEAQSAVNLLDSKNSFEALKHLNEIEQEWGASTDVLRDRINDVQERIEGSKLLQGLTQRFNALELPTPSNEEVQKAHETCKDALKAIMDLKALKDFELKLTELENMVEAVRLENQRKQEEELSMESQLKRITNARKRLLEWREEEGIAKDYTIDRYYHLPDRWNDERVKKPRAMKRLTPSSGQIRSMVFRLNPVTGELEAPKTEEERRFEEMEQLRKQVIESQKRKELLAAKQLEREKELRAQVIKSMKGVVASKDN